VDLGGIKFWTLEQATDRRSKIGRIRRTKNVDLGAFDIVCSSLDMWWSGGAGAAQDSVECKLGEVLLCDPMASNVQTQPGPQSPLQCDCVTVIL